MGFCDLRGSWRGDCGRGGVKRKRGRDSFNYRLECLAGEASLWLTWFERGAAHGPETDCSDLRVEYVVSGSASIINGAGGRRRV